MQSHRWFAASLAVLLLPAACNKKPSPRITADGSSTVFPITEAVAEEFRKSGGIGDVTVGISGTGGGFKKFCAGETDISDASRPIKPTEVEQCQKSSIQYVEIPIAYDGITIVVNPKNDWASSITVKELKKLWEPEAQGKIKKWSDVRDGWPDRDIHLFGAGVDSGTYDYFTEAVVGKEHSSRGDFTSSEDDNVLVQGISNDKDALGFFGFAYYENNKDKVKVVLVDDEKDETGKGPTEPTPENIRNATYQPLSRPLFVYVSLKALERPEVSAFMKYYVSNAGKLAPQVGYIGLPDHAFPTLQKRLDEKKTGSVFEGKGSQVGVTIDKLLSLE